MTTGKKQKKSLEDLLGAARAGVALSTEELARVYRILAVSGRRVQRYEQRVREVWLEQAEGPNRKTRRGYLAQMRRAK